MLAITLPIDAAPELDLGVVLVGWLCWGCGAVGTMEIGADTISTMGMGMGGAGAGGVGGSTQPSLETISEIDSTDLATSFT